MSVTHALIVVFVLYVIMVLFAPKKRSCFVVEPTAETTQEVAVAQTATVNQAIATDVAATAAVTAAAVADQSAATAAAYSSEVATAAATQADVAGNPEAAKNLVKAADKEIEKAARAAEKDKRKADIAAKKAEIEQKKLEKKQSIERAKAARLAVPRITDAERTRLAALDPDEKALEGQVADSRQSLLMDDIAAKKAEIDVLKAELESLDEVVDTVDPPSVGKRLGRFFR